MITDNITVPAVFVIIAFTAVITSIVNSERSKVVSEELHSSICIAIQLVIVLGMSLVTWVVLPDTKDIKTTGIERMKQLVLDNGSLTGNDIKAVCNGELTKEGIRIVIEEIDTEALKDQNRNVVKVAYSANGGRYEETSVEKQVHKGE